MSSVMANGYGVRFVKQGTHVLLLVLIVSALCAGCGGGGGGSGGGGQSTTPPPTLPPPPPPITFTIQADKTSLEPLEQVTFTANALSPTPTTSALSADVEIDVSGLGTFLSANTLVLPALVEGNQLRASAPVLEMFRAIELSGASMAMRVQRHSDQMRSNTITLGYTAVVIPPQMKGVPSTSLQVLLKAMLETNEGTRTVAQRLRPEMAIHARNSLGVTSALADIQAEAILRQQFGVSALAQAQAASTQDKPAAFARNTKLGQSVRDAFARIISCPAREYLREFENWDAAAADDCIELARPEFRDNILPGIAEIPSEIHSITSLLAGVRGRIGQVFGSRVADAQMASELADAASATATVWLTLPFDSPSTSVDVFAGNLTQRGLRRIYDALVEDFPEIAQYALEKIRAPDFFADAVTRTLDQSQFIFEIENTLAQQIDFSEDCVADPGKYGGEPPEPPATDSQVSLPGGLSIPMLEGMTPAAYCAQLPPISSETFGSFGFSCEEYVTPFFNKKFYQGTLLPILNSIPIAEIEAACQDTASPQCEAILAEVDEGYERLHEAIRGFTDGESHCETRYSEFEAHMPNTRICIFEGLVYLPPAANCFDGSRPVPFDIGAVSACMYYSRDYLQPDGACRPNYNKVFFLGTDRCRWATIPSTKVTAYSLNTETGARTTLEQ